MSAVLAETAAAASPWRQFICRACGYIYDEKDGDPDGGLAPGTRYEDIPDDWACPLCGVSKLDFDPYEGPSTRPALRAVSTKVSTRVRDGVVVVGGGLAGWSTARALRARDPDIPIALVASDSADVYPKPGLSLAFGQKKSAADLVATFGRDLADDLSIRLLPHTFVTSIDARGKRLRTTRGPVRYDALVLALGAKPVETPSLPSALCWRINSLETWSRLAVALQGGPKRVAVIGAGLVGCELADDLAHAGHTVAVFDPAARPLAAWASLDESQRLLDGWQRLGVRFMPSTAIARMERRSIGGRSTIVLHHDEAAFHDVDIAVSAIGLCIDRRLAATAGLNVDTGIAVDAKTLATSVPSIYAAGDCISIDGRPCRFIEPIARQAEAIAHAILDQPVEASTFKPPLVRLKTRSAPMTLTLRG